VKGELTRETADLPPPPTHLLAGVNDDAAGPACLSGLVLRPTFGCSVTVGPLTLAYITQAAAAAISGISSRRRILRM